MIKKSLGVQKKAVNNNQEGLVEYIMNSSPEICVWFCASKFFDIDILQH